MKSKGILFLSGLALGIFFSFLYSEFASPNHLPALSQKPAVELKKEVAKSEIAYSKNYAVLKGHSNRLAEELNDTKTSLLKAKQKNEFLQVQVYHLIDKQKTILDDNLLTGNCDSLIQSVEYLMQSSSVKESLYEAATINLEEQLKNKDSTIALKDEQHAVVKKAFDKSIVNQDVLASQNKLLNKQVKRQKFKSKVLSAVLFIASGIAANHLLQR